MAGKKVGVVKSFDEKRGDGLIEADGSNFRVHYDDIDLPGYAVLESGQIVEFDVDVKAKQTARNVRPAGAA